MLAGYLPFDDDPANPDGDNINLLYKYIVTTPLTFPEYVTPHARDLLRRILVPNPRKRADLFEVARHSWLSEYAHVVEFITSSTTSPLDVQNGSTGAEEFDAPMMTRSASVREAAKQRSPAPAVGGLSKAHAKIDSPTDGRTPKDAKRRTVQVEYVAPITQTQRGADEQDRDTGNNSYASSRDKPLPEESVSRDKYGRPVQQRAPPVSINPSKAGDGRSTTENAYLGSGSSGARPQTGGSMQSTGSMGLQSRVLNYGQPAPPTVADTNAQGRIQQPPHPDDELSNRNSMTVPPKFARVSGFNDAPRPVGEVRGHKRSSTLGDLGNKILGRSGSVFGKKNKQRPERPQMAEKKKYPPISIAKNMPVEEPGRASMDSKLSGGRRSFSLGLGKKRSGSIAPSQGSEEKKDKRRFSLLPASFSLKAIGLGKEGGDVTPSDTGSHNNLPIQDPRTEHLRSFTAPGDARGSSPFFDDMAVANNNNINRPRQPPATANPGQLRYPAAQLDGRAPDAIPAYIRRGSQHYSASDPAVNMRRPPTEPQVASYRAGLHSPEIYDTRRVGTSGAGHPQRGVLQKNNKRFTDAYEQDGFQTHEGSSGAAKRVMDFFRRRGKARGGDE